MKYNGNELERFQRIIEPHPRRKKRISLEESLITAAIEAREKSGLKQQQLSKHNYTLATVKEKVAAEY